jgi:putative transposase
MTFMGEASLRYALSQYLAHYHAECNHQGLDTELIVPDPEVSRANGQVNR